MTFRNRTPSVYVGYTLYFYFSGLFLRRASKILSSYFIKRNHVSIWNWIQKYPPKKLSSKRKKINEFVIDENLIKIGSSEYIWLWVAIEEPENKRILGFSVSKELNMLIAEQFISKLVKTYGPHPVSTDGGTWYPPQAWRFLQLKHHLHSFYQKSIIERMIQYIKDRIECFDDFSLQKKEMQIKTCD